MKIIFDFNRTIYDPETGALVPGAFEVLQTLAAQGAELYLVSRREPGRENILAGLGIENLFIQTFFVAEKEEVIKELVVGEEGMVYVVGDHLHDEIRSGNRHGAHTVWLKRGRFAGLLPETKEDMPWRTIERIEELLKHIA